MCMCSLFYLYIYMHFTLLVIQYLLSISFVLETITRALTLPLH